MALDAFVYCDCFETHNLRCDPPVGLVLKPEPSGDLACDATDEERWSAFVDWKRNRACFHYGMILLRHRLGTPEQIEDLRGELQAQAASFPVLLNHVLYSGTHTCDWVPFELLGPLSSEVKHLAPEKCRPAVSDALQLLKIRMAELIIAAQHTKKPICF
jgi:hypothetical protein